MNCAARKGFLTLADCGNPASSVCSECAKPMCAAHLSPATGFSMCYDCAAVQAPKPEGEPEYDETWAHGYRSSYYRSSGYQPKQTNYTSDDAAGFRNRQSDDFDEDDEKEGFEAS